MAGEMNQSEVTAEAFPDLFALRDALEAQGIKSEPRAFDQYQGPYLRGPGVCKVWYADEEDAFLIEVGGMPPLNSFETKGADYVNKATAQSLKHGIYSADSALARIIKLRGKH
jgi:hypothetical protein